MCFAASCKTSIKASRRSGSMRVGSGAITGGCSSDTLHFPHRISQETSLGFRQTTDRAGCASRPRAKLLLKPLGVLDRCALDQEPSPVDVLVIPYTSRIGFHRRRP